MKPPSDGMVGLARRASRVRLGEVCEIAHCDAPVGESKVWLLNLDKVEQQTGRVIGKLFVCKSEIGSSTVPFDVRCVLYSKLRPNLNKVVIPDSPGFATSEILPLLPDESKITRDYLAAYLRSNPFVRYATTKSFGAKMPRLGTKDLMMAQIPLPPIPTQRQIAAVLDKICEMKRNAEARLQKLDLLVKARFVEMFGSGRQECRPNVGAPFLPPRQKKFENRPLSSCVKEMFIGPFGSALKNECFVAKDNAYCMVYEQKHAIRKTMEVDTRYVGHDKFEELKRFTVLPGDLIVSCRGTIGEIYRVPNDAPIGIMHPSIMKIRLDESVYDTTYFVHALSRYMKNEVVRANGSSVKMAVTATALGKELFPLPPLSLQREFAAFVARVDALKATVQAALERTDLLYRAKLQEYFG